MSSHIQEVKRSYGRLPTVLVVNTETGAADLYHDRNVFGRTLIATGSAVGNNWTPNSDFVKEYNRRNKTKISIDQFKANQFQTYTSNLNNDRGAVINKNSTEAVRTKLQEDGVPKVTNPTSGLTKDETKGVPTVKKSAPAAASPEATTNSETNNNTSNQGSEESNQGTVSLETIDYADKQVQITPSSVNLYYPFNRKDNDFDYLQIQVFKYEPGLKFDSENITAIQSTQNRITNGGGYVTLPMYPGLTESNSVDWGSDQLNPLQQAFGVAAINAIDNLGNRGLGGLGEAAGGIMGASQELIKSKGVGAFIKSYFAGQAVGANLLGRSTGMVVNPNLELLFRGPQLRSFQYNYIFTPRDPDEALMIRKIIKFFKKEMAVQRNTSNLFLNTPNVFKLKYVYKGDRSGEHPYLNKIKPCALTSFTVDYTPDGSYMTYEGGSMTSYSVSLQFSELEPIYADDIAGRGGTGDSYLNETTTGY